MPASDKPPGARSLVGSSLLEVGVPVDLIVLACKWEALLCRPLGTTHEVTFKTTREGIPGSIITAVPTRVWANSRRECFAGTVLSTRYDAAALGLTPLTLKRRGDWDPAQEYWAEDGAPIEEWAKPLIAHGSRPLFEMEQVMPGFRPSIDIDAHPIAQACELDESGDFQSAAKILMKLLEGDLRCLDAHAHLGSFRFHYRPDVASRHYEVGVAIGALSLGAGFDGVLSWGLIDNRPFLRCLNGMALCAWRLEERDASRAAFRKLLRLNPTDNQGARFNLAAIEAGRSWKECQDEEDDRVGG